MGKYGSGKKKGEKKVVGWEGRLLPKDLMADVFFSREKAVIQEEESLAGQAEARIKELVEAAEEDSVLAEVFEDGQGSAAGVSERIDEILRRLTSPEIQALEAMLAAWPEISRKPLYTAYVLAHPLCGRALNENGAASRTAIVEKIAELRSALPIPEESAGDYEQLTAVRDWMEEFEDHMRTARALRKELDAKCKARYRTLTDEEILDLLVNRKWLDSIAHGIWELYTAVSHCLANRVLVLVERYERTMPELAEDVDGYEAKVRAHLGRMGFTW